MSVSMEAGTTEQSNMKFPSEMAGESRSSYQVCLRGSHSEAGGLDTGHSESHPMSKGASQLQEE